VNENERKTLLDWR